MIDAVHVPISLRPGVMQLGSFLILQQQGSHATIA